MARSMSKDGGGRSLQQQALVTYGCVSLWVVISSLQIVYNKFILGPFGFHFPVTLTMWHQAFCTLLAGIGVSGLRLVDPLGGFGLHASPLRAFRSASGDTIDNAWKSAGISASTYMRKVFPIGLLYAASLWMSNAAYLYLSVAFVQMLKALMPVSVYAVGVVCGTETFYWSRLVNMAVITIGVAIASYGELNFNWIGLLVQLGAVVVEAFRLVLVELLLNRAGLKLNANPFLSLYYISPCCFLCLLVPFFAVEYSQLRDPAGTWHFDTGIFLGNAATAMGLNLAVYMLIGNTSALTMNVASVIKDWVCISMSNFVFYAPITATQLEGYGIAFIAVAYYSETKRREAIKREAAARADENGEGKTGSDRV